MGNIIKTFTSGLAITIMIAVGVFIVGSIMAFTIALQTGDKTGIVIQLILIAGMTMFLGFYVTSKWYKKKMR